ncbi:MAG: hypothetical protein ACRDSN_15250 [Pseudonocardiaceae bacterium]
MFSSLTHRLGTRVLDRLDLLVELSTLGEYGVDREGVFALETGVCLDVTPAGPPVLPRSRDDCPRGARLTPFCRDAPARP